MSALTDAEIESRLKVILDSPPFQRRLSDYLTDWLRAVGELSPETRWLLLALCVVVLFAIVASLFFSFDPPADREREGRGPRFTADRADDPEALASRARELARSGRLREAVRALHQAALFRLTLQRGIPWRPDLADWEWVALLKGAPGLAEFTRLAQRLAYGPDPDAASFAACERLYLALDTTTA